MSSRGTEVTCQNSDRIYAGSARKARLGGGGVLERAFPSNAGNIAFATPAKSELFRPLVESSCRLGSPQGEERREHAGAGRYRIRYRLKTAAARTANGATVANMTSADKEFSRDSNFSPKASTSRVPTDASPDSKCPICLDRFDNVACLDRCFHRFCFRCVQEWSKNKAECPLCKLPFFSIFHTIRAEDDFKEYILRPQENSSFASPDGRRFRYPTTLTWDRRTGRSSSQRTLPPQSNSLVSEGSFGEPVRHRDGEMQQMTRRPASRRPASRRQVSAEDSVQRRIQEDDMISFRRALYRAGVRIHSIQDGGRYRDISAEFFRCNPACLHRLVPWLKRELTALFGTYASFISTIQHIIMRNVTKYDMESQAFADEVRPFLLNRTEHFLHEFISFARCPFNLEAYDQHANYDCPAPLYDEGSHSDLSVITISPDTACSQGPDNSLSVTGLSQAPWDDETPGPSYSVSEDVHATLEISESSDEDSATKSQKNNLQTQLQANADSNDSDSSSDNCVIVRYVKPLAERTPEVVELSSDSEEPIREEKNEDVNKQQPAHCHSWSDSEPSRSLSPHSTTYKKNVGSCKSCISPKVGKTEAKDDKYKHKVKDLTSQVLSWSSSPGSDTVCSPWNHRLSRNRRSRSPPSCSRNSRGRHGHRSRREHHSKSQTKRRRSRSRDSTKHRSKRSTRRSRAHESKVSLESHRGCFSHESTPSREVSRSRSCSKGHGKRRSRSRDSDRYYVRDSYQGRHQWGCAFCSRKVFGDGFESSSRRKTQSNDTYSRQSPGREHRMRSFIGRADPRSQRGFRERHCHCYERCRSRSRSGSRSRTPPRVTERMRSEKPGGKRKYKTRHLENTFTESTNLESDPKKTLSKFSDCDKNEVSLPLYATSSGLRHSKIKIRSPSVEIVYEGKATEATRQLKKPRKKHRKCYMVNSKESSPLMITIDSDSREVQIDGHCNSTILTGITQISERRNESPSSVLERRESEDVYRVVKETEKVAKKFSIPTRRGNLDGDIRNAEVELQETTANQNLTTTETSSSTETLTSYIQEAPAAPSNQLPSPRISFLESPERQPLMLGVLKGFVNRSSWFNFPEEKL